MNLALINQLTLLAAQRKPAALCTVVRTEGSTPLKTGAKMLVRNDGSIFGTIGGGALELSVMQQALSSIFNGEGGLFEHRLVRDHNMCCGGTVHVYIEPIPLTPQLYIFGAGHVGKALARQCDMLGFEVTVIDGREHIFHEWPITNARCINQHPREALPGLIWDEQTYAVIATHSHPLDREVLSLCMHKTFGFCGMIGSKRKVAVTRKLFVDQHMATEEQLDCINMPVGLEIAAESPEEIAVSIAAKLIAEKNRTRPVSQGFKTILSECTNIAQSVE